MTGVAVDLLVGAADAAGERHALLGAMAETRIVCRGPKPASAIRKLGLVPTAVVREPHTTDHLIAAFQSIDLEGKRVLVLDGGDSGSSVASILAAQGASVSRALLYRWALPEERRAGIRRFIGDLLAGRVDAVAFTAQVQVRFLLETADAAGLGAVVRDHMRRQVIVAVVGPVCRAALAAEGIQAQVEPEHPRMGHMVLALARSRAERRDEQRAEGVLKSVLKGVR